MSNAPLRIYHNKRCSKSRAACQLIAEKGVDAEIIDYLATPPSREELLDLLRDAGHESGEISFAAAKPFSRKTTPDVR
jgi:arsenate reductase